MQDFKRLGLNAAQLLGRFYPKKRTVQLTKLLKHRLCLSGYGFVL